MRKKRGFDGCRCSRSEIDDEIENEQEILMNVADMLLRSIYDGIGRIAYAKLIVVNGDAACAAQIET